MGAIQLDGARHLHRRDLKDMIYKQMALDVEAIYEDIHVERWTPLVAYTAFKFRGSKGAL